MTSKERSELAIPVWSYDFVVSIVIGMIVVIATVVAVLELFFQVAVIVPCIWLAFMAWRIWVSCRDQGSFRKCLIEFLGLFACRQFVESIPQDTGSVDIRFGYRLFGRCLSYLKVPLDKIETVEWSRGQAPGSWVVFIGFDHDDAEKSLPQQKHSRRPGREIYCVGPSRRKKKTEAFGLALVDFLCRAGATMVRGENDCTFVRAKGPLGAGGPGSDFKRGTGVGGPGSDFGGPGADFRFQL